MRSSSASSSRNSSPACSSAKSQSRNRSIAVGELRAGCVAPVEELVHALRLVAVLLALRALLAIEDRVEAAAQLVHRLVHAVARLEVLDLAAQLVEQLLDAHHAHVEAGEIEAGALHPGERFLGAEPFHHQVGERVERRVGVQRERLLRAVPAAVAPDLHASRRA